MLVAVVGIGLSAPAEAQWKWRDKGGHTQYSDLPPPSDVPERDILSRPSAARSRVVIATSAPRAASGVAESGRAASGALTGASGPALAPRTVEPELEAKRKKAEADQAAKLKAEEAKIAVARGENCTRAKAQMRSLDSGIRIARTNDKGEREILDDQQRAEEVKRTQTVIASDCK